MKEAKFYQKLDKGIVKCLACNHYCKIDKNKTGICGVRKNIAGKLFLLVYGKAIAVNIDPVEKKPLYHFLPGTEILSFGTVGCNFKCNFCQNYDISQISKPPYTQIIGDDWLPEKIVDLANKNKIPSIAYTYTEPTIFVEYAVETMKLAKKAGIKNVWVTNGYFSSKTQKVIFPYLDAVNVDLKSFSEGFYQNICGAKLKPVLKNIESLHEAKIHLEITTLIIPSENDDKNNLKNIAGFVAKIDKNIPWHISRFFPCYKMQNHKITPYKTLKNAEEIGYKAGLKNIYIGNV